MSESSKQWLVIDSDALCHRLKHIPLFQDETRVGVIYGFLRYVDGLRRDFPGCNIVFCWDSRYSNRKKMYPAYKANRRSDKIDINFEHAFRKQMKLLRTKYLSTIGFSNILRQTGYEGDDIISMVVRNIVAQNERAIIIASDKDLYQLLQQGVELFDFRKNKIFTHKQFHLKYGIKPTQWAWVKAIAGCSGDNVIGIKGVGDITAIKYLTGKLKHKSKAYKAIVTNWNEMVLKNYSLVRLPLAGTKRTKLRRDRFSEKGWKKVISKLEMKSLSHSESFFNGLPNQG